MKIKIKLVENNVKQYLYDLWVGKGFLNNTQKVLTIREKFGRFDYIKIKDF